MVEVEVIEISSSSSPSSPSSPFSISGSGVDGASGEDAAREVSTAVSTAVSSDTGPTGGTCFLDLPLELRTMVYDLAIPDDYSWEFPTPDEPISVVKGINLLQSCRQIYAETSDRIWKNPWIIRFSLKPNDQDDIVCFDLVHLLSRLQNVALAKIQSLIIVLEIPLGSDARSSLRNLGVLANLRSPVSLAVIVELGSMGDRISPEVAAGIGDQPFLTGLVIQILSRVPISLGYIVWLFEYWDLHGKSESSEVLYDLATKYKSLRGSAVES